MLIMYKNITSQKGDCCETSFAMTVSLMVHVLYIMKPSFFLTLIWGPTRSFGCQTTKVESFQNWELIKIFQLKKTSTRPLGVCQSNPFPYFALFWYHLLLVHRFHPKLEKYKKVHFKCYEEENGLISSHILCTTLTESMDSVWAWSELWAQFPIT